MFEFLEEYVVADEFEDHDKKHTFYPIKEEEIDQLKSNLEGELPYELVLFYQEIGYGYFYDEDGCFTDLLMNPKQVMEFKLGKGNYEYSEEREHLDNCDLVFFEIDADLHIYVKLSGKQQGSVFLGKRKIADSIKEFVDKVTRTSNYFFR